MSRISIRPANRADALSSTKNPINSVKNKPLRMIAYEPKKNFRRHLLAGTALALAVGFALPAHAAPNGGTVANGSASITLTGDTGTQTTTVRQSSARAIINWSGFDLAKGDIVNYIVPDHSSATLNRISGARSQIDGTIQSNGSLYFVNQNGFVFGADSHVTAQNLIVTTQAIDAAQFMQAQSPTNSGNYQNFTGTSLAAASIELNGTVTVADRGVVAFFAPQVTASKSSVIAANLGSVTLAGSENITVIDFKGDGLINFQLGDSASQILAKHEGVIRANGGQVILTAHGAKNLLNAVLEENGTVDASSAQGKGGDVTLVAANGTVTIGKNAVIDTSSAKDPAGTLSVSDSFNSAYIGPITFAYWALVQQQNENQAVADLKASQTITIESGAVLRANGHAARNIGVTHNSTVNSTVVNEGSIYVNASNKLNNSGSLTSHSGSIALTAGGDVQNDGTLTVNNAVGKAGDILVTGATITLADGSVLDASSASGSAGNIKLGTQTGDLWIAKGAKILAKSVNGYGIVTLQSKSNLQFDGTIDAAAAVVNVDVGQDFVANGVIDLSSTTSIGGDFHANAANILVTENGVINASSKVSNAGAIILGHASTTANVTIDLGGKLYANSLAGLKGGAIKLNANQTVQNNGTIQAQGGTISLLAQGPDNVLSAALINNGVIDASAVIGDGGEVTLSTTSGIVTLGSQSVIDVSSLNGKSGGKVIINDDYTGSLANVHESATDVAYKKAKANLDQKPNDFINTTHDRERARSAVEAARKDYDAAEVTLANAKLELESVRKEQTPSEDSIKNATQKVADATQNFATATRALRDANVKFESFAAKIDAAKLEVSEASGEYIVAQYKLAHDPISNLAVTARVKGQTVTFAEGSQIIANGSSGGSIQVRAFKNLLNNGTIQSSGGGINLTATQNLVNNGTIDGSVLSGQGGVVILQVSSWAPPRPP
ncbi:MAG: filamentous hemagglutinin N-terminal domain-containing protein, partial [Alphaproteobacteria bacterium]|nr:filamentous hemagglutinin N-terminal domain-containing protein [Alphaproteobacteria bacterium]